MELTQRGLVNRNLRLRDGEIITKYVFPFWDAGGRIPFAVIDRLGKTPVVLRTPVLPAHGGAVSSPTAMSALQNLGDLDPAEFRTRFHFDPWWVFRGMGGVADAWKRAILAANVARPFRFEGRLWKVHDVEFDPDGTRMNMIRAKDETFRPRLFTPIQLDFDAAWPKT